ncbi:MAG: bifunctional phosphopantothenoylcysteine decarboxylase/phosphopantothenate--cysteine ligase CoaBC [Sandaracinaceae bacterium]|nr:bifunctional phosphopantothenoylcysteine decarboxylase/phosphopantothenate--cysteine ligase CoaBC [Sandaracinaceae bacterium]
MRRGVRVLVGVSGGIAAYKAALLVRELMRRGHEVRVVMTEAATRFVGPITFTGLTGAPPVVDLWDARYAGEVHVELAEWADAMVVAPATAHTMARAAGGIANDALTATLLCFDGPVVFAPAMHTRMWKHPATARNVAQLRADGAAFVGPTEGPLASGDVGLGRMAEPDVIAAAVEASVRSDLAGFTVLVSAGGTHEDLDPVRFLGNRSTGKMGYALAERAAARGAHAVLVSGPTSLATPSGVERIDVRSALEMEAAILERRGSVDAIVMAAAVADYRPAELATDKLKKTDGPRSLELVRNPDILAGLGAWREGSHPVLVGFALETQDVVPNARAKLARKRVDLVVANHATDAFGKSTNRVTLVAADSETALPELDKRDVADAILDWVRARLPAS